MARVFEKIAHRAFWCVLEGGVNLSFGRTAEIAFAHKKTNRHSDWF